MTEYIEREAALEIVEMYRWGKHLDRNSSLNAVRNGIDMIPAADVAPVVHGRWLWDSGAERYFCSNCNVEPSGLCNGCTEHLSDYCPNCGARMEEV